MNRVSDEPGHDRADCTGHADGDRQRDVRAAELGSRRPTRRRRPLQRPPLDDARLHPGAGEPDRTADGTAYTDTVAPGTYYYKVTAEDAAGNVGPASNEANALVGDTTAPGAPGTLTAVGAVGTATLSWGAAGDNVGVVRYNVHRGSPGFTPSPANRIAQPTGTGYTDAVAAGSYAYRVTAEDAAGNLGPASNEATATVTTDTTAPTAPSGLGGSVLGSTVNLTWTGSTDAVGVVRYNVHRSASAGFTPAAGNRIGQPTGTSYSDAGLASGTYYYKVTAEDAAGNISGPSNESPQTVADGTAPTAPSGVAALAAGSTINVSWTAATDNIGVVRYNVHRGAHLRLHAVGGQPDRAADRHDLRRSGPGAGHLLLQAHRRGRGREHRPGLEHRERHGSRHRRAERPGGLTAVGGSGQAALGWTASSDNVGVLRYNVHRSTTPASPRQRATGSHSPPERATRIRASQRAPTTTGSPPRTPPGNISGASAEATATVTVPPAVGLVGAYGFDEGVGTTTADQSGTGNNASISGAPGRRRGSSATRSASTASTTSSRSPTRTASTSRTG